MDNYRICKIPDRDYLKWDDVGDIGNMTENSEIQQEATIQRRSLQPYMPHIWGSVLVKIILKYFSHYTEIIKICLQLFLWYFINNYISYYNYLYVYELILCIL